MRSPFLKCEICLHICVWLQMFIVAVCGRVSSYLVWTIISSSTTTFAPHFKTFSRTLEKWKIHLSDNIKCWKLLVDIGSRSNLNTGWRRLSTIMHSWMFGDKLTFYVDATNFELCTSLIGRPGKFASYFQFHFLKILFLFLLLARHICTQTDLRPGSLSESLSDSTWMQQHKEVVNTTW